MNSTLKHPCSNRFELGRLHILPGAGREIDRDELLQAIRRHARCDWGDCDAGEQLQNTLSLVVGRSLFSKHHTRNGTEFHVITLLDHSTTVVLLPDECWF
jgi:hypothetical protein